MSRRYQLTKIEGWRRSGTELSKYECPQVDWCESQHEDCWLWGMKPYREREVSPFSTTYWPLQTCLQPSVFWILFWIQQEMGAWVIQLHTSACLQAVLTVFFQDWGVTTLPSPGDYQTYRFMTACLHF